MDKKVSLRCSYPEPKDSEYMETFRANVKEENFPMMSQAWLEVEKGGGRYMLYNNGNILKFKYLNE